jgi:hypothetical protein
MYVLGSMGTQLVIAKLKADGSGNGTYGGFTYSDTSVIDDTFDIINKTIQPYIMTNTSYVSTSAPLIQGNPSFTFTVT